MMSNDATSLQLCLMASPSGFPLIEGADGLRRHIHSFKEWGINKASIGAYYVYFEEFGIVYCVSIDDAAEEITFSEDEILAFRDAIWRIKDELDRRRVIH